MSENKYSLICSTFTGTLNKLHFILFIHLSSHFIFQFLHVVFMEYACLLASERQIFVAGLVLSFLPSLAVTKLFHISALISI